MITDKLKDKEIRKEILKVAIGALIVFAVLIANGLLSFIGFGFDWNAIYSVEYWINFSFNLVSGIAVFFGIKIIRETYNLKDTKITTKQSDIKSCVKTITNNDKTREARVWIRDYHNYLSRLERFESLIDTKGSNLLLYNPTENEKGYDKKKKLYDKEVLVESYLRKQKSYIKKDKERLTLLVMPNKTQEQLERYAQLQKELEVKEYHLFNSKVKFEIVTWDILVNDTLEQEDVKVSKVGFNKNKETLKELPMIIIGGVLSSAFLLAFRPFLQDGFSWLAVFNFFMLLIYLCTFALRGILSSDRIIKGVYLKALTNRLDILKNLIKDLDCIEYEEIYEEVVVEDNING